MTQPPAPNRLPTIKDLRTEADQTSDRSNRSSTESAPWFGYIGLGIALVAMLLGLGGMVGLVWYFIGHGTG